MNLAEHLALGAGAELGTSRAAGNFRNWPPGLVAVGLVAGFKEGADAISGRDTKREAIFHALSILAGAGIAIGTSRL